MAVTIQLRRDTASNWTSSNPVLAQGELGLETDTAKYKIGNGSAAWTGLAYSSLPSNAIDTNTVNAKGDILVGTADNAVGVLALGTGGYVLMVDSSTATGVKWAAIPPSGGLGTTTEGAVMTMDIGA